MASVAGREALGSLRKKKPSDPLGDDDLLDTADDPELTALKERHSADFKRAFQAAVAALPARDRPKEMVLSPNDAPEGGPRSARSTTHGDFDDDPETLKATLARILGHTAREAVFNKASGFASVARNIHSDA